MFSVYQKVKKNVHDSLFFFFFSSSLSLSLSLSLFKPLAHCLSSLSQSRLYDYSHHEVYGSAPRIAWRLGI